MRIQHNIMAMNAYRNYTNNTSALAKNLEKLSSGYRINRAGDDAAGLAISEKMRAQITALGTAQKNVKDGISLVKTAEGATQEIHDMLNRMVDLATQSANGTYQNEVDREAIQDEFNALKTEINRIADSSNFNGIKLLDGSLGLNGDAFKIEAGNTYAEAVTATTSDLAISNFHGGKAVDAQAPGFKINLDQLEMTADAAIAAGATFATIEFAGKTLNLQAKTGGYASGSTISAADIGDAIVAAFQTLKLEGTASSAGSIGGAGFSASNAAGVVTFKYQGKLTGGTDVATAATDGTDLDDDLAAAINAQIGSPVKITGNGATLNGAKEYLCDITAPKNAVAANAGDRPGADIDLAKVIQDGYKIKIDDQEFTIKTDKNSTYTGNVVDVSMHASGDQAKMAAMIIAGGIATDGSGVPTGNAKGSAVDTTNFHVSYKGGTTIHVDALDAKRGDFETEDKIQAKIQVTTKAQDTQYASTKLTVTEGKLEKGNVITVGDKSFVYKGDGSNAFTSAADLAGKLTTAGYKTTVTDVDGKKVLNIEGKKTNVDGKTIDDAKVTAPSVVGKGLTLQIGEDSQDYNQLSVAIADMHTDALGLTDNVTLANQEGAQAAVDVIKNAINSVSSTRGKLGATQNRLEHTANNLSTMKENIQDAEATIRDTDIAEEMMAYTKNNILVQSAQAMLAQANQIPQGVLQLLG